MASEIEAKIPVDSLDAVHQRLLALGAADEGVLFERNQVFDDESGSLEQRGMLLRIRSYDGVSGILTVKRKIGGGVFKTREEVEVRVDSVPNLQRQLEILGYRVAWLYEKRRRTLRWENCIFALDECPEIGCFVEIEADEESIRAACAAVGLDPSRHLDDNYLGLWRKHLAARGEAARHMVF